ncbi:MAG TPA: substrate-binding domain-containing protein [Pirellulales bacterium]|nr:substrate-binding domain-containing protein [Pirellulales bacterium]
MRPWRLAALAVALLAGCNNGATQPAASGPSETPTRRWRIAVIPKGSTHEFWSSVHAGAEKAAAEAGNVEVLWKGPLLENDREQQINIVDDFRVQHVDGICLAPLDSQSLIASVEAAKNEGIPTVIFDSALDNPELVVSYVATDNYRSGVLAAERLAQVLDGNGDVVLMRYSQGSESTFQREEGFLATLKEKYPDIQVLSSNQYAGSTAEISLDNCQQMLLKYRDDLDGVFTVCESNSAGMLGALENEGLAGKVRFIAFDPNARLIQAMADGKVDGILLQDPVNMGYLAVKTMVAHLNDKPVEQQVDTGEYVATPENMHEPDIDKLLHPVKFGD